MNQTIGYLRWADKDPMIAGLDAWSMDGMVDAHGTMHLPKLFDCCACPPNFSLSLSLARASLGSAAKLAHHADPRAARRRNTWEAARRGDPTAAARRHAAAIKLPDFTEA